jgi:predicted transcriptional regulator
MGQANSIRRVNSARSCTPLTTIAMLAGDLVRDDIAPAERGVSGKAIPNAVLACKSSLNEMVTAIGADRPGETTHISARQVVERLAERSTAMRSNAPLTVTV